MYTNKHPSSHHPQLNISYYNNNWHTLDDCSSIAFSAAADVFFFHLSPRAVVAIPSTSTLVDLMLPFIRHSPHRHWVLLTKNHLSSTDSVCGLPCDRSKLIETERQHTQLDTNWIRISLNYGPEEETSSSSTYRNPQSFAAAAQPLAPFGCSSATHSTAGRPSCRKRRTGCCPRSKCPQR